MAAVEGAYTGGADPLTDHMAGRAGVAGGAVTQGRVPVDDPDGKGVMIRGDNGAGRGGKERLGFASAASDSPEPRPPPPLALPHQPLGPTQPVLAKGVRLGDVQQPDVPVTAPGRGGRAGVMPGEGRRAQLQASEGVDSPSPLLAGASKVHPSSASSSPVASTSTATPPVHAPMPQRPISALRRSFSSSRQSSITHGSASTSNTGLHSLSTSLATTVLRDGFEEETDGAAEMAAKRRSASLKGKQRADNSGPEVVEVRYPPVAMLPIHTPDPETAPSSFGTVTETGTVRPNMPPDVDKRDRGDNIELADLQRVVTVDPPEPTSSSMEAHSAKELFVGFAPGSPYPGASIASTNPTGADSTATPHFGNSQISSTASRAPLVQPTDEETRLRLALLGYTQELNRDWDLWASVSLTVLNIGTVQGAFWALQTAMVSGGPVMMSTSSFVGGLILLSTFAILGEFASAYPVAGAMFTWVFKLARSSKPLRDWARFLSWLTGSFVLVGHIFVQVLVGWQSATVFQGIINGAGVNLPPRSWFIFVITVALIVVSGAFALMPFSRSPKLWKTLGLLALAMFIITCATLVSTSRRHNPLGWVFTNYINETGFESSGYVYLLGWVYTSFLVGAEAAAHMAEETKNPAKTVPRSMFLSLLIAYVLTWVSNICVLVALPAGGDPGDRPNAIVAGRKGEHVWLISHAVYWNLPRHFAILVLVGCFFQQFCANLAGLFATTRFAWALARDSALPFASVLKRVSGKAKLPRMATLALTATSIVIAAPIIATLNRGGMLVVSALFTSCLYFSVITYMIPIIIYLTCPKDVLQLDGRNVWTLRAWSRPLSYLTLACLVVALAIMACPNGYPVRVDNWSWSPVVTVVAILLSAIAWIFYGNARYAGPIRSITVWTTGREVGLPRVGSKKKQKVASLVKEKTTTMAKGETAAVFEGSLPTEWSEGEYTSHWGETGMSTGEWSEGSGEVAATAGPDQGLSSAERATETQATARRGVTRTESM